MTYFKVYYNNIIYSIPCIYSTSGKTPDLESYLNVINISNLKFANYKSLDLVIKYCNFNKIKHEMYEDEDFDYLITNSVNSRWKIYKYIKSILEVSLYSYEKPKFDNDIDIYYLSFEINFVKYTKLNYTIYELTDTAKLANYLQIYDLEKFMMILIYSKLQNDNSLIDKLKQYVCKYN